MALSLAPFLLGGNANRLPLQRAVDNYLDLKRKKTPKTRAIVFLPLPSGPVKKMWPGGMPVRVSECPEPVQRFFLTDDFGESVSHNRQPPLVVAVVYRWL